MIISIFIFLILAGAGLSHCNMRRIGRTVHGCTLLLFVLIGAGVVPAWLLRNLQSDYATSVTDWGRKNAIVVLGSGSVKIGAAETPEVGTFAYARLGRALVLYNACMASGADCKIIVSGGDPRRYGQAEALVYNTWLRQSGVPAADLIAEADSMNTWQNAQFSSVLLKRMRFDRIVLVTSAVHMPRSLAYFAHFGVHPAPVRAEYLPLQLSWIPLSYHFFATDIALHEYVGMWRYCVYNYMGWNQPR
jgi:uncharacterized SAM-binding protein YcdF (DUF218 family)